MKPCIFSTRGGGPALDDQARVSENSTDMPASVLEPLHARSGTSATNPFREYDNQDASQQLTQVGGARTAFASASGRTARAERRENAAPVLYPEGLPKFLGVLQPTMTFGICNSTLSRGMDFIAHFVAITTIVCFVGILIAVSWMQKLCLPIVRDWNGNYTFGFGAFMAVLAIFSWRSAANFDVKRSKVFLFLLGWRLHFFLLLSLLMAIGLALKPQLHAHIESRVRACVLESSKGELSPFHPPVSTVFALPTLSSAAIKNLELPPILGASEKKAKNEESPVATADSSAQPVATAESSAQLFATADSSGQPVATPAEAGEGDGAQTSPLTEVSDDTSVANQPAMEMPSAPSVQASETPSVPVSPVSVGEVDSKDELPVADNSHTSNDEPKNTNDQSGSVDVKESADAVPAGPEEVPKTDSAESATEDAASTKTETESLPEGSADAVPPSEDLPQENATSAQPETDTDTEETAVAPSKESEEAQGPAHAEDLEKQNLAVLEAQRSAVEESNAIVVIVLVLASTALMFELYLMYACWSFKVWMERGFESVVLAGAPSFSTVDSGNGWLAYAVRMPQTVQMETYGNDVSGSRRLPLFVQTTDTSDCAAHLGLPMTGRW